MVYPGAQELCDGKDNDCDGAVDAQTDDALTWTLYYPDLDGDGYGAGEPESLCAQPSGYSDTAGDCDDGAIEIHPNAPEQCNGQDDDCDADIDENWWWYLDQDGDLFGTGLPVTACDPMEGYALQDGDCDDQDSTSFPEGDEVCDGRDNDCNGEIDDGGDWFSDGDGDGFGAGESAGVCPPTEGHVSNDSDCDDDDPETYPGALDCYGDGVDHDCDGTPNNGAADLVDEDVDGWAGEASCGGIESSLGDSWDCDDSNPLVYPFAEETCNGLDDDCDGLLDEVLAVGFRDGDGDGYGDGLKAVLACPIPEGYVEVAGDCTDSNAEINPGQAELCNGRDDDCDGLVDAGLTVTYFDGDGDGFGDETNQACDGPGSYVRARGDCNDADPAAYPGAWDPEGDGVDQDCGGTTGKDPHVGLSTESMSGIGIAIWEAGSNTTIWVGPGTYLEHSMSFLGKVLTLKSTQGPEETTIDGENQDRLFVFDESTSDGSILDGFHLTRGHGERGGGAILVDGSSLTFRNLIISQSSALFGGGLAVIEGAVSLESVQFMENNAEHGCEQLIDNDPYDYNPEVWYECPDRSGLGGGLYAWGAEVWANRVVFEKNQVLSTCLHEGYADDYQSVCHEGYGGGLLAESSDVRLQDTRIESNQATNGGGLWLVDSLGTLSQLLLKGNIAESLCSGYFDYWDSSKDCGNGGKGGGIGVTQSQVQVSGVVAQGNVASAAGAALWQVDSSTKVRYLTAYDNLCTGYWDSSNILFSDGTYESISLPRAGEGGAVGVSGGSLQLEHSILVGNQASRGGGIWLAGRGIVQHTSVLGNTATSAMYHYMWSVVGQYSHYYMPIPGEGGGFFLDSSASTLDHVVVASNLAEGACGTEYDTDYDTPSSRVDVRCLAGSGAGIYLAAGVLEGDQLVIAANGGEGDRGGWYDTRTSPPTAKLDDLQAPMGTALLLDEESSATLAGAILAQNTGDSLHSDASREACQLSYGLLHQAEESMDVSMCTLGPGVLTGAPRFLAESMDGFPSDFHLTMGSPGLDTGIFDSLDPDGTRADMGIFGGPGAEQWDRDGDGVPDWFWPGRRDDAPPGYESSHYDADDGDKDVQ